MGESQACQQDETYCIKELSGKGYSFESEIIIQLDNTIFMLQEMTPTES